ncbi:MAG: hypothetical protein F4Y29_11075 [Chloroflexi bacterium]|nr:hypothetical protein [Chloroflexota bacterium]MYF80934.1 hypothetical protein [Chloroflexota bacterium]MYJ01213.1 hypothetical protein [Chloroflexota bacterium]
MTAATTTMTAPRPTLEELVDRVIDAIFGLDDTIQPLTSPARAIHEARRLRQSGDLDRALAVFTDLDLSVATEGERRWAHAEFLDLCRRRFHGEDAVVYRPGTGRAAVLTDHVEVDAGTLEVRAVLGMRWRPGKLVSQRSLRGLRPLAKDAAP